MEARLCIWLAAGLTWEAGATVRDAVVLPGGVGLVTTVEEPNAVAAIVLADAAARGVDVAFDDGKMMLQGGPIRDITVVLKSRSVCVVAVLQEGLLHFLTVTFNDTIPRSLDLRSSVVVDGSLTFLSAPRGGLAVAAAGFNGFAFLQLTFDAAGNSLQVDHIMQQEVNLTALAVAWDGTGSFNVFTTSANTLRVFKVQRGVVLDTGHHTLRTPVVLLAADPADSTGSTVYAAGVPQNHQFVSRLAVNSSTLAKLEEDKLNTRFQVGDVGLVQLWAVQQGRTLLWMTYIDYDSTAVAVCLEASSGKLSPAFGSVRFAAGAAPLVLPTEETVYLSSAHGITGAFARHTSAPLHSPSPATDGRGGGGSGAIAIAVISIGTIVVISSACLSVFCCRWKTSSARRPAPSHPDYVPRPRVTAIVPECRYSHLSSCNPPQHYLCPISQEVMHDPVTCADGHHTFERGFITKYLLMGNSVCPLSRSPLLVEDLTPNTTLKEDIDAWAAQQEQDRADSNTASETDRYSGRQQNE